MSNEKMAYVATTADQPNAAYAAVVDNEEYKESTADVVAEWIKDGAIIERVSVPRCREMLAAWKQKASRE